MLGDYSASEFSLTDVSSDELSSEPEFAGESGPNEDPLNSIISIIIKNVYIPLFKQISPSFTDKITKWLSVSKRFTTLKLNTTTATATRKDTVLG